MNADAIVRVTEALRGRLEVALASSGVPGTVFVGPLDDADASGAALILFLYRIIPSASLRNREHRVSGGALPVQVHRHAFPLDLFFLVTVGSTQGASEEGPLRALGFVMQSLQAEPDLVGAAVNHETVHVTFEPLTTEEASRIWALFPNANYRTSVAYLATPVWIDPAVPEPIAARVVEDHLFAGARTPGGAP